jgi:hypothetical protein
VWSSPRSCRRTSSGSASVTRSRWSQCSPPHRGERTRRSAIEATRRWRAHPTVSTHTGEGLKAAPRAHLSGAAHRSLGVARYGAREGAEERNEARVCATPENAVLFGREPRATVGLRWTAHDHRTKIQPRREEAFPAQAQVAAWSTGSTERERAGGPVSVSGRMAAWHVERGLRKSRPRAVFDFGPLRGLARGESSARASRFSFSGRISQ